jgi:hypothetical protein
LTTIAVLCAIAATGASLPAQKTAPIHFIVISDLHYGITRQTFRGRYDVAASTVNAAMRRAMNALSGTAFPPDGGIGAGRPIGAIDFVAVTGDITNRSENGVQSAAESWKEFTHDYLVGLTLTTADGARTPVWAVPGNHDASNAIGYTKPLVPSTDATSMAKLYNLMVRPTVKRTATTYNYATDKVHFSRDVGEVHFSFLNVWPDSAERVWLDGDLRRAPASAPVILFAHVAPSGDPKLFKDAIGSTAATIEARALATFVKDHPRIAAYFHGHNNWNDFYIFTGPDRTVALRTFRIDSPMKGKFSAPDESKLSFQIVVVDPKNGTMTVREYLWNARRDRRWGAGTTISLR